MNESTAYATKESSSGVSGSTVGPTCTSTRSVPTKVSIPSCSRTTRQQSPPNVEALPSASTDASTGAIDDAAKAIVACEMGAATVLAKREALGALLTTEFGYCGQTVPISGTLSHVPEDGDQWSPTSPGSILSGFQLDDLSCVSREKRKRVEDVVAPSLAVTVTATATATVIPIPSTIAVASVNVNVEEDEDAAAGTNSSSSVTASVFLRPAREQFSTRELVALYHRIMSEQFTVGQQVRVQYGTNCSELWFPAVIRLQNPDGMYQIVYHDLDESDPTAAQKKAGAD
jgi:hypothetical protein